MQSLSDGLIIDYGKCQWESLAVLKRPVADRKKLFLWREVLVQILSSDDKSVYSKRVCAPQIQCTTQTQHCPCLECF